MAIPKGVPPRYTSSKQLIAGADINTINDRTCSFQTLTPTGATQGAAAAVDAANIEIPAGAASAGIRLPVSYPGAIVSILNNSSNNQNIYPNGTDKIQNSGTGYAAASAAVVIATLVSWDLICIKTGQWQRTITS